MQQPFMPNFVERFRKITENKTANNKSLLQCKYPTSWKIAM
jgi:hypothetical protein